MPEETQPAPPSISPTLGKHQRNWKKILLTLLILGFSISLIGVGVWFLTFEPTVTSENKSSTTTSQKQPTNKKGVLYLKPSGESDKLSGLGDLWIYDLDSGGKTQITNDGRVGSLTTELSPDGKKIAYRKNINGMESIWLYDIETKKTKKLNEFSTAVSDIEYTRIEDIVWRNDSESLAWLVVNRQSNEDPRNYSKITIHFIELTKDSQKNKVLDTPPGLAVGLLVWNKNEIYYKEGAALGPVKIKTFDIESEKISEKDEFLEKLKVLPVILGSPDSQKIAVSGNKSIIFDVKNNKEIITLDYSVTGWTIDGNGLIASSEQNDKAKVTIYSIKDKKSKFAYFSKELLRDVYGLFGFSDHSRLVFRKSNSSSGEWGYYLLDVREAKVTKLPFTTSSFVTITPIENY